MTQESTQQATALDAAATTAVNPFIVVPPPAPVKPAGRFRRACDRMHGRGVILAERGMATAEYGVGILAAVALAIALLNIFQNNEFLTKMLKFVVDLIGKAAEDNQLTKEELTDIYVQAQENLNTAKTLIEEIKGLASFFTKK